MLDDTTAIRGPGTYILLLELRAVERIRVGKLGRHRFAAGHYAYVGSAFGPGGLAARLAHHLKTSASPHWHIDYLRPRAAVRAIWHARTDPHTEHQWARALMQLRGASVSVEGFGSSDCRCRAHLVHLPRRPRRRSLRRHWQIQGGASRPPIRQIRGNRQAD